MIKLAKKLRNETRPHLRAACFTARAVSTSAALAFAKAARSAAEGGWRINLSQVGLGSHEPATAGEEVS